MWGNESTYSWPTTSCSPSASQACYWEDAIVTQIGSLDVKTTCTYRKWDFDLARMIIRRTCLIMHLLQLASIFAEDR